MKNLLLVGGICLVLAGPSFGHVHDAGRADSHAPIGVMGDHTHHTGEKMLSYRYMSMSMDGNQIGNNSQSIDEVLDDFMMAAPKNMSMDMHMLGFMMAPSDELTLMLMVPYISKSMDHVKKSDRSEFTRETEGLGDIKLSALMPLKNEAGYRSHATIGISLPTGAIDEKDGQAARLPYPMQLGSGTYDVILGLTASNQYESGSVGGQLTGTFRFGENEHDYRLGNRYDGSTWIAQAWNRSVSTSLRAGISIWKDIHGADSELNPMMVSTAVTDRSGQQVYVGLGANFLGQDGWVKGHRIATEIIVPVIQRFDSSQLKTDWTVTFGWQKVI